MDRNLTYIVLISNLVVAIFFYVRKGVEVPFFIAFFNIMVEYRLFAIEQKWSGWVQFDYGIPFIFNLKQGAIVSDLIVLGSTILMYSFICFYKPLRVTISDTDKNLKEFIRLNQKAIIIGLVVFSIFQVYVSGSISRSYGFYAKFANSSFIILLSLLLITSKDTKPALKLFYFLIFGFLCWVTYSETFRFQFLGWMVPVGYYICRNIKPSKKIFLFFGGLFLILVVFSSAGVMRNYSFGTLSPSEFYKKSVERFVNSEDVNFIDGFIMVYQIYPKKLEYTYGFEHLGILIRAIPRPLWPDKPLAGWVLNYSQLYKTETPNVGFSPTLYGVFFAEAGTVGVVVLSIIWGRLLAYLYVSFQVFRSSLRYVLVGILLSSMIPIFRSGDLAGDFSIVLMSYWPMIIFTWKYKNYLRKSSLSTGRFLIKASVLKSI